MDRGIQQKPTSGPVRETWAPGDALTAEHVAAVSETVNALAAITLGGRQVGPTSTPGVAGFYPVRVYRAGGVQGNATTAPTWVYDVTDLAGVQILAGAAPEYRLTDVGQYLRARNGETGIAYTDANGAVRLFWVPERFRLLLCDATD